MNEEIEIIGHRGVRNVPGVPENSPLAFDNAIKGGANGVEWDVFYVDCGGVAGCEGGELVVTHGEKELTDRDITPPMDNDKPISDFTLEQIKRLRLRDCNDKVTAMLMPTNNEVLSQIEQSCRNNIPPGFTASIEIKHPDNPGPDYIEKVTAKVVADIKNRIGKNGWQEANFEVRSFNMDILEVVRKKLDAADLYDVRIGALIDGPEAEGWKITSSDDLRTKLQSIKNKGIRPDDISLTWQSFDTPGVITAIRELFPDAKLNAWTWQETPENMPIMIKAIREKEIDTIITDRPGALKRAISETELAEAEARRGAQNTAR